MLKNPSEWNMSRRRFGYQTGEKLTRTGKTKVRVFRELPETTLQLVERVEKNKTKKNWDRRMETSRKWAEWLKVLSNTNQELLTQSTQVNNEQSNSRCWPKQSKKDSVRWRQMSMNEQRLDDSYTLYSFCSCWWWSTILIERFCTFHVKRESVTQLPLAGNPMFEQFEVDDYLTDNTTVQQIHK